MVLKDLQAVIPSLLNTNNILYVGPVLPILSLNLTLPRAEHKAMLQVYKAAYSMIDL
jgi:hypothetical protein